MKTWPFVGELIEGILATASEGPIFCPRSDGLATRLKRTGRSIQSRVESFVFIVSIPGFSRLGSSAPLGNQSDEAIEVRNHFLGRAQTIMHNPFQKER